MERSAASVDAFLAGIPGTQGVDLRTLDAAIAPVFGGERVLWEGVMWGGMQRIVGYGLYAYRGRSGASGEWFIVGIAAGRDHLSMHVSGAEGRIALAKRYGATLGTVKIGSGVVTFRRVADVALDKVVELAVRARDSLAA